MIMFCHLMLDWHHFPFVVSAILLHHGKVMHPILKYDTWCKTTFLNRCEVPFRLKAHLTLASQPELSHLERVHVVQRCT